MKHLMIVPMQPADLDFADHCIAVQEWASETRLELEGLYGHSPEGCLIAESEGQKVGIVFATHYGEYGFIGNLIVLPEHRGKGIGRQLVDAAVNVLERCGAHNIYLDGVQAAVPLYERAGFRAICRSLRFVGNLDGPPMQGQTHPSVRAMTPADMDVISSLDQEAFGANRRFFLERRLTLYPDLCKVMEEEGQIAGFVFGRQGEGIVMIGPWLALPHAQHPGHLLENLVADIGDLPFALGVLETNVEAAALLRTYPLAERPHPPIRMVYGESDRLGHSDNLYAVGTSAKG